MQFYIEEFVEKMNEMQLLSRRAYISFLRAYTCYAKEWKSIFNLKNLHIGHVAKSFGLREAPKEIAGRELKLYKGSPGYQQSTGGYKTGHNSGEKRDKLESRQARDIKRLSNNHREYGNVAKKNKVKSQRTNLDLR
jgi:ATP-dependent RNA helicase DDX31/DBP7